MDTFSQRTINRFQEYRSRKFSGAGKFLIRLGINADGMTFLSALLGLGAVYFLFQNQIAYILLAMLYLFADAIDGIMARLTKPTTYGKYLDAVIVDGGITLLILIKIGWFLHDYYSYIIAGMYLLALCVYGFSRLQAPMLFTRTITLVAAMFYFSAFPITAYILVLNYLTSGVAAAWSLALQLQWMINKCLFSKD